MTIDKLARFLLAVLLPLFVAAAAAADRRVLVLRDAGGIVHQTGDALLAELETYGVDEGSVAQFDLDELGKATTLAATWRREHATVAVVALGPNAIRPALQLSGGKPAVVAVVSRTTIENGGYPVDQLSAITLDQPPERIFNVIQVALPNVHHVGVLAGAVLQPMLRQLERYSLDRHLTLVTEPVANASELVAATESLASRVGLLLAIPDPVVHNRNTILPLLLATYRAGVPVMAYSESYLQAGAALALYSTPVQIAQQTAEVTLSVLDGKRSAPVLTPKYFTVGVNSAVTRSLGLSLPSAAEIEQKVQKMEKAGGP